MDIVGFENWLTNEQKILTKKTIKDLCSRLSRLEHELIECDLDEEYEKDYCETLLKLFKNLGNNELMANRLKKSSTLPIKRKSMTTFPYAIRWYIKYKKHFN